MSSIMGPENWRDDDSEYEEISDPENWSDDNSEYEAIASLANWSDDDSEDEEIAGPIVDHKRKMTATSTQPAKKQKKSDDEGDEDDVEDEEEVEAEAPFNPANNTKTFTCFPRLPIELRQKIFGHAADNDCAIIAQVEPTARRSNYDYTIRRSGRGVPALLHVCREAREECIEDDMLERIDIVRDRASNGLVAAHEIHELMATAIAGIKNNELGVNKKMNGKESRKCTHARWKLFTFDNSYVPHLCTEKTRIYFCAQNDTFWGLYRLKGRFDFNVYTGTGRVPIAPYLRHFATNGAVESLNDVAYIWRTQFPGIETITCLLPDHTIRQVRSKRRGIFKRKYHYFKRTPEVNGQLSTVGFSPEDEDIVEDWINTMKTPDPDCPVYDDEDVEILIFRFEAQFVKNEIPELWTKTKYRKGL